MRFHLRYNPVKDSWFVDYNLGKPQRKSFKVSKYIDMNNAQQCAERWLDEMVLRSGRVVRGSIRHDGYEGNMTILF